MIEEYDVNIDSSLYDKDLDEVGWEPEVIDDSDKESANKFGYK